MEEAEEKLADAGMRFDGEDRTPLRDVWRFLPKIGEDEMKRAQGSSGILLFAAHEHA